jgi:hypothetical protein
VPDTLSGPGLRDDGSHVNLYVRPMGIWSATALAGVAGREGVDESSDIKVED